MEEFRKVDELFRLLLAGYEVRSASTTYRNDKALLLDRCAAHPGDLSSLRRDRGHAWSGSRAAGAATGCREWKRRGALRDNCRIPGCLRSRRAAPQTDKWRRQSGSGHDG